MTAARHPPGAVCHSAVLDCTGITVEAISPPKSREGVCQNSPCASIRRHQDHRDPYLAGGGWQNPPVAFYSGGATP
jgi:hypothetical protein